MQVFVDESSLLMDFSSFSSDSLSICCSYGSSVYRRMLLSSSGTLVQCCIGEMRRSVSSSRWQRSSCSQNYSNDITTHDHYTLEDPMEILYGAKTGVHAFGYNSTESEPNWMNSGALWGVWAHCWGLALADIGRDPRSSDSLRSSRNVVFLVR